MKKTVMMLLAAAIVCSVTGMAAAAEATDADPAFPAPIQPAPTQGGPTVNIAAAGAGNWQALAMMGACLGAGVVVIGGGMGISRISSHALESIARQPEAAAQMFLAWLIPAAMIEGATLFAVVVCFMVIMK